MTAVLMRAQIREEGGQTDSLSLSHSHTELRSHAFVHTSTRCRERAQEPRDTGTRGAGVLTHTVCPFWLSCKQTHACLVLGSTRLARTRVLGSPPVVSLRGESISVTSFDEKNDADS